MKHSSRSRRAGGVCNREAGMILLCRQFFGSGFSEDRRVLRGKQRWRCSANSEDQIVRISKMGAEMVRNIVEDSHYGDSWRRWNRPSFSFVVEAHVPAHDRYVEGRGSIAQ